MSSQILQDEIGGRLAGIGFWWFASGTAFGALLTYGPDKILVIFLVVAIVSYWMATRRTDKLRKEVFGVIDEFITTWRPKVPSDQSPDHATLQSSEL